nr:MAG TPA: hypothetical protein [Caudoviricetes sp.]
MRWVIFLHKNSEKSLGVCSSPSRYYKSNFYFVKIFIRRCLLWQ